MTFKIRIVLLAGAMLLAVQFRLAAAATNGVELRQWVRQYLPDCKLQPESAAKPRTLVSPTGQVLDLTAATRENPQLRKGSEYWKTTLTMDFLSRQRIAAGTTNDAIGVIKLLHVIWRGPDFVKQRMYEALPFEGGWVVEAGPGAANPTNRPGNVALPMQPYELLLDDSQRVVRIQQRSYPYRGSARVYADTVRTVYEREMRLNGGVNYPQMIEKELAKAWELEKAQKTARPAPKKP
jgi:hypothetical protein